jgi:hypothetical protein
MERRGRGQDSVSEQDRAQDPVSSQLQLPKRSHPALAFRVIWQKQWSASPIFFVPRTLGRTWGTRLLLSCCSAVTQLDSSLTA